MIHLTFSSLTFLFIFLPVIFILYAVCANNTLRNVLLAAASLIFYAFGEPVAVIIMIISIICNYFLGIAASKKNHDKAAVIWAVVLNLGLLIVFKYLGFILSTINSITGLSIPVPEIKLPIGISFFTFQGLSYVIDVYRDKKTMQKNLLLVFLYISFFPQLIAGPIVKYHDIEVQLKSREFSSDRVSRGLKRFIWGLGKKVLISNQMGLIADSVFNVNSTSLSCGCAWLGAICYSLQIFFDFSGYSDMAIGLGCIFGFDFKENFNYPYISCSMKDFWRRWHISLSTWFKEYLYIPLGGNRKGKARAVINRCIVFFCTGLWHGANLTFIVWGLLHGMFMLLEDTGIIPTKKKWFKPIGHIYALLVTVITFVIFRADNIFQSLNIIKSMFTGCKGEVSVNKTIITGITPLFIVCLIFAVLLSTPIVPKIKEKLENMKICSSAIMCNICQYTAYISSLCIFALCIFSLISSEYNPFIYFRF